MKKLEKNLKKVRSELQIPNIIRCTKSISRQISEVRFGHVEAQRSGEWQSTAFIQLVCVCFIVLPVMNDYVYKLQMKYEI